jgi:hypothetical protein
MTMNSAGDLSPAEQVRQAIAEHGRPYWLGYVPMSVIRQVDSKLLGELIVAGGQPTTKRNDKYQEMLDWCYANAGEEISAYSLAEMFDMTPPTTRKFINDRIDLFKKVKHGFWTIRDVIAERQGKNLDTPLSDT